MKSLMPLLIAVSCIIPNLASASIRSEAAQIPGCSKSAAALRYCEAVINQNSDSVLNGAIDANLIESISYEGPGDSVGCTWQYGFVNLKDGGGTQKMTDLQCDTPGKL